MKDARHKCTNKDGHYWSLFRCIHCGAFAKGKHKEYKIDVKKRASYYEESLSRP